MNQILLVIVLAIVLIGSLFFFSKKPMQEKITAEEYQALKQTAPSIDEPGEKKERTLATEQATSPSTAELDFIARNLVSGGVPKDGIPAIDKPIYISREEADTILDDGDIIFGIDYKGTVKAFPQNILYWHEIVNEEVQGEKISLTYCPLTGSVIGYKGNNLGVSGALYNSNLVIYDRKTDSIWPQMLGVAVTGERKGEQLEHFPVFVTTWGKWKVKYPNTLVLSQDIGSRRDYSKNPYPGYDNILRVWFPVAAENNRFPSKKWVTGIEHHGEFLAVPKEEFKRIGEKKYILGGEEIIIRYDLALDIIQAFAGEKQLKAFDTYWFAWYAYHPDTKVLGVQ